MAEEAPTQVVVEPEVVEQVAVEPAVPQVAEAKPLRAHQRPRTEAQIAALKQANEIRASAKQERNAARLALEEKARSTLVKRFGEAAVQQALNVRRAGRPTVEGETIRGAQEKIVAKIRAGEEVPSDEEVDDTELDDFVCRLAIAHLKRHPHKRRALDDAVDEVVKRRLGELSAPQAAAAAAPSRSEPAPAPAAPTINARIAQPPVAPAKRAVVLL